MICGLSLSAAACSAATSSTEGVVGLAETDLRALELLLDEAVPVEVVGGLERKERGDPNHHRAQGFVAEVEVVVREAASLAGEDAVIWILGGVFGDADAKARPLFHALEDEVDAVGVVPGHAALPGQDMVFLAHAFLGPFDRQPMIAGEGFHPVLVVGGAVAQDLPADDRYADHVTGKVPDLPGPREPAEVAVNDNAVEAVVDEGQQIAEQLGEQFHGNPLQARSGSKTHQAWTRQADSGAQEFSSGRGGALYPAPGSRSRRPHRYRRSAGPVLHRNRRCLAARPRRSARGQACSRRGGVNAPPRT